MTLPDSPDTDTLSGDARLVLRYCAVATMAAHLLEGNPKLHDTESIWASFERHGFKDPAKWEPSLNEGQGGLGEGNGRTEALVWGYNEGYDPPAGILLDDEGHWYMPILFGVDSASQADALAYSFDHNNLTMAGGDFSALEISRLYDHDAYVAMLDALAEDDALPLTIDEDELDLIANWEGKGATSRFDKDDVEGVPSIMDGGIPLSIILSQSEYKEWQVIKEGLGGSDTAAFLKLMRGE